MAINFSGRHYPPDIIMMALRYYFAYKLSYRDIEEIFAERNIHFDHSTLNRWVIEYAPLLETSFRKIKRKVTDSWRMDETYIKVKGKWVYYIEPSIKLAPLLISIYVKTVMSRMHGHSLIK